MGGREKGLREVREGNVLRAKNRSSERMATALTRRTETVAC